MEAVRAIEPFYFGPPERQLFGLHHRPPAAAGAAGAAGAGGAAGSTRDAAVLVVQPHGHESIQFHRVCRLLAVLLAEAGYHVLRFDLGGCGDSAGDVEAWGLEAWTQDVERAAAELARRASTQRLGVVGLRLGGSLAARFGAGCSASATPGALVLWDAVHDGAAHLRELAGLHDDMLRYAHVRPRPDSPPEVLGFDLPASLAQELEAFSLRDLERAPTGRALVVESHDGVDQGPLRAALEGLTVRVDHQRFSNPHLWAWTEDFAKVHVPRKILDAIVAWLREALA